MSVSKADGELRVFLSFAAAARLNIEKSTVRSELPPKPDIWCEIDGAPRFFELTRVADSAIANDIGFKCTSKGVGSRPKVVSYSDREVVQDAVIAKVHKSYETLDTDFDLLLYCDGLFHPRVEVSFIREAMRELESMHRHRWGRIWLYDAVADRVLWPEEERTGG